MWPQGLCWVAINVALNTSHTPTDAVGDRYQVGCDGEREEWGVIEERGKG